MELSKLVLLPILLLVVAKMILYNKLFMYYRRWLLPRIDFITHVGHPRSNVGNYVESFFSLEPECAHRLCPNRRCNIDGPILLAMRPATLEQFCRLPEQQLLLRVHLYLF